MAPLFRRAQRAMRILLCTLFKREAAIFLAFLLFQRLMHRLVGDAFVAIDTRFALALGAFVLPPRSRLLIGQIHDAHLVAVPALAGIGLLHGVPNALRQFEAFGLE